MKHKRTTVFLVLALALALFVVPAGLAGAQGPDRSEVGTVKGTGPVLSNEPTADELITALVGSSVTVLDDDHPDPDVTDPFLLKGQGVDPNAGTAKGYSAGTFGITSGFDDVGFNSGVILSTGWVVDAAGPNLLDDTSGSVCYFAFPGCDPPPGGPNPPPDPTAPPWPGDDDLTDLLPVPLPPLPPPTTYEATVLDFWFECPDAGSGTVSFQYVFASEEYNEFVNRNFNDVFAFYLNDTNIALVPGTSDPVSVDTVNLGTNSGSYVNNDRVGGQGKNIEADGFTAVLGAQGAAIEGPNHIKLAIADAGDAKLDSWVFIEEGSFECSPLAAAGFVTGGGWIDPLEGRANFGLVARYKKGDAAPTGSLQFRAGDVNFQSDEITWLGTSPDGASAQIDGTGTVDGEPGYMFTAYVQDRTPDQADTFKIKIWKGSDVVYENGANEDLGGGSIVIHEQK